MATTGKKWVKVSLVDSNEIHIISVDAICPKHGQPYDPNSGQATKFTTYKVNIPCSPLCKKAGAHQHIHKANVLEVQGTRVC